MSKYQQLEALINLGFDKAAAIAALQSAKGQLDRALDLLLVKTNTEAYFC